MSTPTQPPAWAMKAAMEIAASARYATKIPLGREELIEIAGIVSRYCDAARSQQQSLPVSAPPSKFGTNVPTKSETPLPVSGETQLQNYIRNNPSASQNPVDICEYLFASIDKLSGQLATERAARELDTPTITGRTKNIVRERLGEVLRHTDGPNSASHGCVEVTKAYSELEYWIARAEAAEAKSGDADKMREACSNALIIIEPLLFNGVPLTPLIEQLRAAIASVPAERTDVSQDTMRTGSGVVEYDGAFFCTLCGANWGAISHPDKPCEHNGKRNNNEQ